MTQLYRYVMMAAGRDTSIDITLYINVPSMPVAGGSTLPVRLGELASRTVMAKTVSTRLKSKVGTAGRLRQPVNSLDKAKTH